MSEKPPPILDAQGKIAVKYRRQQRVNVACNGSHYIFSMKANISMCWVLPGDLDCVLAVKGGCCGQRKPGIFIFASESDARRWTNGGGR